MKINVTKAKSGINIFGRFLGTGLAAVLLVWYFMHPDYYGAEQAGLAAALSMRRTWIYIVILAGMGAFCLIPVKLPERINRIIGWVWFGISPFLVYFALYYMNAKAFSINFMKLNPITLGFTFWFLYLVLFLLLVVTGSIRASVIIMASVLCILGIANRFVIAFRGMAIAGSDLFSIGAAATVASGYTYKIIYDIFAEICLLYIICVCSFKIHGFRALHWKARTLILIVWLILAEGFFYINCKTSFLEDHDIRTKGFTHQLRYKKYDFLFTTLITCFYMVADKPDGYSIEKIKEISKDFVEAGDSAAAYQAEGDAQPAVIVIMNESFADYTNIGNGIRFSEDPMPFIHGLTENTIKGNLYTSIFGANTPNSEYEFLTGCTMGFLPPTSVGFNTFVRGDMPSLASQMKAAGYNALAMHPFRGRNYRRNIVYKQIGFDEFYDKTNFAKVHLIRNYISDQSLMERIEREYEKNKSTGKPFFSWNVTMQNHGGYTADNNRNLSDEIKLRTTGINTTAVQQYANLIKASDDAFRSLVEYFSDEKDPVIVIFFGDHQANLGDATYHHLIGDEESLSPEELMEKYKIPFVCWANFDIEEEIVEKTSLNYLYSMLADKLGLPMTGYQKYLLDLSQEIPVLTSGGYWTKDGAFYELKDENSPYFEKINDYNILEYNYILGKNSRYREMFDLKE